MGEKRKSSRRRVFVLSSWALALFLLALGVLLITGTLQPERTGQTASLEEKTQLAQATVQTDVHNSAGGASHPESDAGVDSEEGGGEAGEAIRLTPEAVILSNIPIMCCTT